MYILYILVAESLPAALFADSEGTPSIHTDDTWSRGTPEELDSANVKPLSELDKRVSLNTLLVRKNENSQNLYYW